MILVQRSEALTRHATYYANLLNNVESLQINGQYSGLANNLNKDWEQIQSSFKRLKHLLEYPYAAQLILNFTSPIVRMKLSYSEQIDWVNVIIEASRKCKDELILNYSLHWLAHIYGVEDNYDLAHTYELEAIEVGKQVKDPESLLASFVSLARTYQSLEYSDQSIEIYRYVIKASHKLEITAQEVNALHGLVSWHLAKRNFTKSRYCIQRIFNLADAHGEMEWRATGYELLGLLESALCNYDEAISNYYSALRLNEQRSDLQRQALNYSSIGGIYASRKDYDKALAYHNKSLSAFEKNGDERGYASQYLAIGRIYTRTDNVTDALLAYQTALSIYQKYENDSGVSITCEEIGNLQRQLEDYESAIESYRNALTYIRNTQATYWVKYRMAQCHQSLREYEPAVLLFEEARAITETTQYFQGTIYCLKHLAEISSETSKWEQAVGYWDQVIEIAKKSTLISDVVYGLWKKADIYTELEDYHSAIIAYRECLKLATGAQDATAQLISLRGLAVAYSELRESDEAIDYLNQLLKCPIEDEERGFIYFMLGRNWSNLDELENATENYLKARQVFLACKLTEYVDIVDSEHNMLVEDENDR